MSGNAHQTLNYWILTADPWWSWSYARYNIDVGQYPSGFESVSFDRWSPIHFAVTPRCWAMSIGLWIINFLLLTSDKFWSQSGHNLNDWQYPSGFESLSFDCWSSMKLTTTSMSGIGQWALNHWVLTVDLQSTLVSFWIQPRCQAIFIGIWIIEF